MSKYGALTHYLAGIPHREVRLKFSDIERVLNSKLPASARSHRAWWSNNGSNSVMTKAWLDAGWRSEKVDMTNESLVFRRANGSYRDSEAASPAEPSGSPIGGSTRKPLLGGLKGTVRIYCDLTLPLDEIWSANQGQL